MEDGSFSCSFWEEKGAQVGFVLGVHLNIWSMPSTGKSLRALPALFTTLKTFVIIYLSHFTCECKTLITENCCKFIRQPRGVVQIDELSQNFQTLFWWKILDLIIKDDSGCRRSFIQTPTQIKHTPHMAPAHPYDTGVQITGCNERCHTTKSP